MKKAILICLITVVFASALYAAPDIREILNAPFPSSLISARSKERVAWVFNEAGKRNIWIGDAPDYKPRKLTNYTTDDGQEMGSLCFSANADHVIYVRGGDANSQKEHPNPASNPRASKQEVYAIKIAGGEAILLGEGSSPIASSVTNTVVFGKDGQLYSVTLENPKKPQPLFQARGQNGAASFSPDGRYVSFVSSRGDHNFVGIYDLQQKTLKWIAPDVDLDSKPVWSPDGKQIAFYRFPGQFAEPPTGGFEISTSFSILVADVSTGVARTVWTSPNATGGFWQFYPSEPLMWSADNHLVFYSESDGWSRIYSVPAAGGKETALSPPNCEAEFAILSADRKNVLFNSNCEDIERRHLWIVPAAGGTSKRLTQGKGIEWSAVPAGTDRIVFLSSTATQPAAPAVMPLSGGSPSLLANEMLNDFPMKELVEPQTVVFKSMDGMDIHGQLFLPPSASKDKKYAALVYMHGGPIRQMLPGFHYMDYYHNAYGMNQHLALNGYIVLSVNFRCGIGYGRNFRLAKNTGPHGASEYQDIVAAARFLLNRNDVDPGRIGLWGGSYGGYLTAMGLARDSQIFRAGVDFHGVHDWALRARLRGAEDWGIRGDEMMRKAFDSSPVADVDYWTSPVLFIMGDDDRNVDFIETTDLVQRLRAAGKAHIETLIFPDEVHDLLLHENWIRSFEATLNFFNKHLAVTVDAN